MIHFKGVQNMYAFIVTFLNSSGICFKNFSKKYPAFLLAAILWLQLLSLDGFHILTLVSCIVAIFCYFLSWSRIRSVLFITMEIFFFSMVYPKNTHIDAQFVTGVAIVEIQDIEPQLKWNRHLWRYTLLIRNFTSHDKQYWHIPVIYRTSDPTIQLEPKSLYQVPAELQKTDTGYIFFSPKGKFEKCGHSWSLLETRLFLQHKFSLFITHVFDGYTNVQSLVKGMLIGKFEHKEIQQGLKHLGLQHIMVISGFHFSFLCVLIQYLLRSYILWRKCLACIASFSLLYSLFIGPTPSVLRAFCMIMLYIFAQYKGFLLASLEALGLSVIAILLYEPIFAKSLGFQMSFLATLGILLFYSPIYKICQKYLPPLDNHTNYPLIERFLYKFACCICANFSLSIAVMCLMGPYLLAMFGSFPLASLLYNLFLPQLLAGCLCLCLIALCVCSIPIFGAYFVYISAKCSDLILGLLIHVPESCICTLSIETNYSIVFFMLIFLSIVVGMLNHNSNNKHEIVFI